ncbi:protein serine/threonine kinase, putative [Entamoeba invadens IP1]|uniref:Protein serine/threonine kinase, putative n=1 Tax=Entamoeba invadens IP1 TaxID=370355 RepID=A0A0A1UAF7_ENTIV|nr:protein serine/threonine kinase, putative [Entamoeba invadens IP1]ELP92028.1 protein serine/threonine kinase, putative [Entamoeba invadens IP1]|eukprot:XP_004258799.1 protein serine/threonine kinase, putative [Entamoeba invadens IP1]
MLLLVLLVTTFGMWCNDKGIVKCFENNTQCNTTNLNEEDGILYIQNLEEVHIECQQQEDLFVAVKECLHVLSVLLKNYKNEVLNYYNGIYHFQRNTFEFTPTLKTTKSNTTLKSATPDTLQCNGYNQYYCSSCVTGRSDCSQCILGYFLTQCGDWPVTCRKVRDNSTCSFVCGKKQWYYLDDKLTCMPQNCQTIKSQSGILVCGKCKAGFSQKNNLCYPPLNNCGSSDDGECEQCNSGYHIVYDYCNPNKDGCVSYNYGTKKCDTCKAGYYKENDGCTSCNMIEYCNTCNLKTRCTECYDGFALSKFTTTNTTCKRCPDNCNTCAFNINTKKTDCTQCKENYYVSNKLCNICDQTCGGSCADNTGICKTCSSGLIFKNPLSTICEPCRNYDPNCEQCSGVERACFKCDLGYYPINGKCTPCHETCVLGKCDPKNGACSECKPDYTVITITSPSCQSCTEAFSGCQKCSQTLRKCETCQNGQYPDTSNGYVCVNCASTCPNCNSSNGNCITCLDNYVFKSSDTKTCEICSSFDSNCVACASNYSRICIQCKNSEYYISTTGKCVQCEATCARQCDGPDGICTTCSSGNVFNEPKENKCIACSTFDSNCLTCASGGVRECVKCNTNYYPSTYTLKCIQCNSTCSQCDQTTGRCTTCDASKVFTSPQSEVCESCQTFDPNCKECVAGGERKCSTCNVNYYPDKTSGMCVLCDNTCVEGGCDPSSGICNTCKENYVFKNPKQIECESCTSFEQHCSTCSPDFSRKCVICSAGYYVDTSNNKCKQCDSTCGGKCDGVSGYCTGCSTGYVPTEPTSLICESCTSFDIKCSICLSGFERKCFTCKTGKYPDEITYKCKDCDETCGTLCDVSNGLCKQCKTNYVVTEPISKVCISCRSFDSHCTTCASDFTRKCVTCDNNYYPDASGRCVPCSLGCSTCNSQNGTCQICVPNHIFDTTDHTNCSECSTLSKCVTCPIDFSRKCIACQSNMYPIDGVCANCHTTCGGTCNTENGECTGCQNGFVFSDTNPLECVACQTFDPKCTTCSEDFTRTCKVCNVNNYPQPNGMCGECDTSCGGQCDTSIGICTGCSPNFVFNEVKGLTCQNCTLFDPNCKTCNTNYERRCTECQSGYYLVGDKCVQCHSTCGGKCDPTNGRCTGCISNNVFSDDQMTCIPCNQFNSDCTTCASNGSRLCETCTNKKYASNGNCVDCLASCKDSNCDGSTGICVTCANNYVNVESNNGSCQKCSEFDSNCKLCASNADRKCVECQATYYPKTVSDYRCQLCDETCGGLCDTRNGYCIGCLSNHVLYETETLTCQSCTDFDAHCTQCSSQFKRECMTCNTGYYPDPSTHRCIPCHGTCATDMCDTTTGICKQCIDNYVFREIKSVDCVQCDSFAPWCKTCASNSSRICVECKPSYYTNPSTQRCQKCDTTCGNNCNGVTGYCIGCLNNFVLISETSLTCQNCSLFDPKCVTCSKTFQRECVTCTTGYYPNENTKICKSCGSNCNSLCNTESGVCYGCLTNHVFENATQMNCIPCKTFDIHCLTCYEDYSQKCKICDVGFYPNEQFRCVPCSTIQINCNSCNQTQKECLRCKDPYYLSSPLECNSCPTGFFKSSESGCGDCNEKITNCKQCGTVSVGNARCSFCYSPYVPNVAGNCILCSDRTFYTYTKELTREVGSCQANTIQNCVKQMNSTTCVLCEHPAFLSEGNCVTTKNCLSPSTVVQTSCDCSEQISINSDCVAVGSGCKYQNSTKGKNYCVQCNNNYRMNTQKECVKSNELTVLNDVNYQCRDGQYLDRNNMCQDCDATSSICLQGKEKVEALKCSSRYVLNTERNECASDSACASVSTDFCERCQEESYELNEGKCVKCSTLNCKYCVGNKCLKCVENTLLYEDNRCISKEEVNCVKSNSFGCVQCKDQFYTFAEKNKENKFDYCLPISTTLFSNCKRIRFTTTPEDGKCIECLESYKLKEGKCAEFYEEKDENLTLKMMSEMHFIQDNTNNKYDPMKGIEMQEVNTTSEIKCESRTNKGCQRCSDGYYYNNLTSECNKCDDLCETCYNTTYCLSCTSTSFLDSTMVCKSLGNLISTCQTPLPTGGGCAICKDEYFKVEKDCLKCDMSCAKCSSIESCLECADGYFKFSGDSKGLCRHNTTLLNCSKVVFDGCDTCDDGYFVTVDKHCQKCPENCQLCESQETCTLCLPTDYVLVNSMCQFYSSVENCEEAKDSKCTRCKGSHEPSTEGDLCVHVVNLGVAIGVPLSLIFIILVVIATIIIVVYLLMMKKKEKVQLQNICVFEMSRSNIPMSSLNKVMCSNKNVIHFDLEDDGPIPVDAESRDLICIGNTSKHNMKVQFSVLDGCDYYEIRTVPSLISLKKGEACEFEIFIKPLCSCEFEEYIMVIGLDIKTGVQYNEKIRIEKKTENSTKLNYREIEEHKKIGEGSFGVVFKGVFRGKTVAIKKMKISNTTKQQIDEFEKEVSMLDKFRNDYIIHFYGACFIPSHIEMVTEFAQYGSLADMVLEGKKESSEVSLKIKIKMMTDAAKGIQYLHENGILHRDIKPDNLLVISLEENVKANAKLTDFGSSRNINMLMTNMTFTKGVGTPKYMAPEVLNKEKYKTSSDVFSLAITMYETLIWGEAYPKKEFKYAWAIADFITSGKRRERTEQIREEEYQILSKMWKQKQEERPTIDNVIQSLEDVIQKL